MPTFPTHLGTNGPDTVTGSESDDFIKVFGDRDTVWGLGGNDLIRGGIADDTLYGGDGDDILAGYTENDTLAGGAGDDRLFGGDGDDRLYEGEGIDRLYGGAGVDWLFVTTADGGIVDGGEGAYDTLFLDLGGIAEGITVRVSGAPGELSGRIGAMRFRGIESVFGYQSILSPHDDTLLAQGCERYVLLDMGAGDDLAYGGSADDSLVGGDGNDRLYGRADDDHLHGGAGDDLVYGGRGNDNLSESSGTNVLNGGAGNDFISGGTGADTMLGGAGSDYILVTEGNDTVYGGSGGDTVQISATATAHVYGGSGIDTIEAIFGNGSGIDISIIDLRHWAVGRATVNGCEFYGFEEIDIVGKALIYLASRPGTDASFVGPGWGGTIIGGAGNDTITFYSTTSRDQKVVGRAGNDTLYGTSGHSTLIGGTGDDNLFGGYADDTLMGGRGDDRLNGREGSDLMHGGLGADTFVFTYMDLFFPGFTRDRNSVTDFSHDQGDIIDLGEIDGDDYQSSRDSFIFIGNEAFSGALGELRYRHVDGADGPMTIVMGDINGDGVADLTIYLSGTLDLVAEDFVL